MRFTRRARLMGVTLMATAGLILAGCGGGEDDGGATDSIITVYGTEPQNPLVSTATNEVGGGNVIDMLFAGLVSYETDGSSVNEVAESIESEDNQTWTITLEEGWEFTDGTPVTAESFVNAWNYGALSTNAQLASYFYYPIKGYEAVQEKDPKAETMEGLEVVDERTFTVELKQPEADFPGRLGYSAFYPLPEAAFGEDGKVTKEFGENPIGNGPYMMDGEGAWEHNAEIRTVPNENYEGVREPQNGGVTFKLYTDPEAAYTDVQAGNLDIIDAVPPSALSTYQNDGAIQAISQPGSVFSSFTIPASLSGFGENDEGDLRRQALSMAINRAEICEKIYDGARTPAVDFSAPVMPGFTEDIPGNEVLEHNPEEAKRLWDEANDIAEFEGPFVLSYNTDGPGNKEFVEAIVNQLRNTLDIEARPKAYATFDELRTEVTDRSIGTAFRTGWQPDYPSIFNYLAPIYGTDAGSNDGDYSNPEFDQLMEEISAAEDEETQYQLQVEAQSILMEDLPAIPLWYQDVAAAAAEGVENVEFNWQNRPVLHLATK